MAPTNFLVLLVSVCLVLTCFFARHGHCKSIAKGDLQPPLREIIDTTKFLERLVLKGAKPLDCTENADNLRNGLLDITGTPDEEESRWESFNVYMDPSYDNNERTLINNAMFRLSVAIPSLPILLYAPDANPTGDYVHIKKEDGCWSHIGKRGGVQELSLASPGCMNLDTIMHEMIHALGFDHEHCRSDRDDFVTINWENIEPGEKYNFDKADEAFDNNFGIPYNTRSIMHYGSNAFSRNGKPTIVAKDGSVVGRALGLQQTDIDKLQKMYSSKNTGIYAFAAVLVLLILLLTYLSMKFS